MKSTAHLVAIQKLIYQNIAAANLGDASGLQPSATAGSYYAGLHATWAGLAGNQTTGEASYSGYARVAIARSALGFTVSAGGLVTLTSAVQFATAGVGATGTLLFWTLGTASSGTGTLVRAGGLGGLSVPATMVASTDVITSPNLVGQSTGLANADRVVFWSMGGTVPAGLVEGTAYYVVNLSGNTFKVESSVGGGAINITADGACFVQRLTPITLAENVRPELTTSTTISDA